MPRLSLLLFAISCEVSMPLIIFSFGSSFKLFLVFLYFLSPIIYKPLTGLKETCCSLHSSLTKCLDQSRCQKCKLVGKYWTTSIITFRVNCKISRQRLRGLGRMSEILFFTSFFSQSPSRRLNL